MSRHVKKNLAIIRAFSDLPPTARREVLRCANSSLATGLCEIIYNILQGKIRLSPKHKSRFNKSKRNLRLLGYQKRLPLQRKRKLLVQSGGFLSAILPLVASIVSGIVSATT